MPAPNGLEKKKYKYHIELFSYHIILRVKHIQAIWLLIAL